MPGSERRSSRLFALTALLCAGAGNPNHAEGGASRPTCVTQYPSIQAAIDANPGCVIGVPPGRYEVSQAIVIRANDSGLAGYGTIVQTNPDAPIIDIERAIGARICDLTLTRPEGRMDTSRDAVRAVGCEHLTLAGLRVRDNRSDSASIRVHDSRHVSIRGCEIRNYKRIGVDDRTSSELYGYAFRAIIGDGILIADSRAVQVQDNRITEENVFATAETKERFQLGRLTEGRRLTRKGKFAPPGDYVSNWHQGSAIVVTSPEATDHILVAGNLIENAAQGVDIHADHVTFSNNVIRYAFIGIKCMHGARNVVIANNNVSHNDLWGLIMQPGTASHPAQPEQKGEAPRPARGPNITAGNLIANNMFSDFGFGYEYHNWQSSDSRAVLSFQAGPLPENPPLTDILITGNIIYDTGRDGILREGQAAVVSPRYTYAVSIDPGLSIQHLHFAANVFHPGTRDLANIPLPAASAPTTNVP